MSLPNASCSRISSCDSSLYCPPFTWARVSGCNHKTCASAPLKIKKEKEKIVTLSPMGLISLPCKDKLPGLSLLVVTWHAYLSRGSSHSCAIISAHLLYEQAGPFNNLTLPIDCSGRFFPSLDKSIFSGGSLWFISGI